MVQQITQRVAIRPTPDELALVVPRRHALGQLNLMVDQRAPHPVDRAETLELLKNERDHRLRLLVRVFDHLARGPTHRAHRHPHAQFATLGFGPLARLHTAVSYTHLTL